MTGHTDQANHSTTSTILGGPWMRVTCRRDVSQARGFQDGHADYSSALFEQQFIVRR